MAMSTLFAFAGWKRKTTETTGEEISAAEAEKRRQKDAQVADLQKAASELRAAMAANAPTFAVPTQSAKKKPSMNPDAVRKRAERKRNAKKRKRQATPEPESAGSSTSPAPRVAVDPEAETHFIDGKGRRRKRKTTRSRAHDPVDTTGGGGRKFSVTERSLIVEEFERQAEKLFGRPSWVSVRNELMRKHPLIFGTVSAEAIRVVVLRHQKGEQPDGRGRPEALPVALQATIIAVLTAVVSTRTTTFSAPMLHPIVLGVVAAQGYASLLNDGRNKRGVFVCGLHYVRGLMKDNGWSYVKPQGNTRKLPKDWAILRWAMVLRLAYYVFVHEIPRALVLNADHTGVMFTQVKGGMWITAEAKKAKDKSVGNHGDKRQFTLLASSAADGVMAEAQVVVKGSTSKSLPVAPGGQYKTVRSAQNSTDKLSVCFTLTGTVLRMANIASFCCTSNHWSDDVTSYAYIVDVAVPFFKRRIQQLLATDPAACKPFKEQACVLIVDIWWGWIDPKFKAWLASTYPWIKLLFVPGSCTPVAQPMDAGIIAKIKGKLRKYYGKWAMALTAAQLNAGKDPTEVRVPMDVPTCKRNLFSWISQAIDELNTDPAGIAHCWESTELLRAWDRSVQVEAMMKKEELFPNLVPTPAPDPVAASLGDPFTHVEGEGGEEEWISWVDWASQPVAPP